MAKLRKFLKFTLNNELQKRKKDAFKSAKLINLIFETVFFYLYKRFIRSRVKNEPASKTCLYLLIIVQSLFLMELEPEPAKKTWSRSPEKTD